ncbi:MAG: UbiA-like protein EboC [Chitinophagales bacterium]|jgi:4-hydroxybenzoate polyprenyltransferase|nr:UbiA-like protein EboC [Chitinophagales bacterium]
MNSLLAYLRLSRPANIVTAIADILAGYAVTLAVLHNGIFSEINYEELILLNLATIGLYGGGVIMNDVADYELDKLERPERPLPSGHASRTGAGILGMALLIGGIIFAYMVSLQSAVIAVIIAVLALFYDFKGKHHKFFGPLNMGLCRGGNLLLGMSALMLALENYFLLATIPILYIAAITMISRGEVVGGNRAAIRYAAFMYAIVVISICLIAAYFEGRYFLQALGFIILFAFLIYRPLIKALQKPEPINIRNSVKTGVISLIVMDAAVAACFVRWEYALLVLALFPISIFLAKVFAVT